MKKILMSILFLILLVFFVSALQGVGEPCLNDDECTSGVCEGSLCQSVSIMDLSIQPTCGDKSVGEACLNPDECQSCVCEGSLCQSVSILDRPPECGDGTCNGDETCSTCQEDCGPCPGAPGSPGSPGSPSRTTRRGTCLANWDCTQYGPCIFGKKTRTCDDLNHCDPPLIYGKPAEEMQCEPPTTLTCNDGFQNCHEGVCEEGVDCGGPCDKICETCNDGIENCPSGSCEEGVDCGGPCMPCSWWKVSGKATFWVIFITAILVLIILVLGFWYWKIKKTGEIVGATVKEFTQKPPTPPAFTKPLPPVSRGTEITRQLTKRPPLEHF